MLSRAGGARAASPSLGYLAFQPCANVEKSLRVAGVGTQLEVSRLPGGPEAIMCRRHLGDP